MRAMKEPALKTVYSYKEPVHCKLRELKQLPQTLGWNPIHAGPANYPKHASKLGY